MTTMSTNREALRELLIRRLREQPLDPDAPADHSATYRRHVNESVHDLLSALDLDVRYVHGAGTVLRTADGRSILDFAGAYGALPLGHNPDSVWGAIARMRDSGEPSLVQLSIPTAAAALARALVDLAPAGLDHVTFANSGAETIEAALKMARARTGRNRVLSTDHGFHGKTLGALSATGNAAYQEGFGAPATGFDQVPYGDAEAAAAALAALEHAVMVVEPIQGEGGVIVPPPGYLAALRAACDRTGTLLLVDEVQTGLGRTGDHFAVLADEVVPDLLTVAKALGGGLLPIGAVLARADVVTEHFSLRHTSTFAGGALACRVGLAVLERLQDPALQANVRARSQQLRDGLEAIAKDHPQVISDVRGRGLLLGVEFTDDINLLPWQSLLGSASDGGNLAMLVTSHLLTRHHIRVAPTLFGNRVLRVEPPLTVSEPECAAFLTAFEATVRLVSAGDTAELLAHLGGRDPGPGCGSKQSNVTVSTEPVWCPPASGQTRFAFVAHPLDAASLADFDPTLAVWTDGQRLALLERLAMVASELNPAPFLVGSGRVISETGAVAHGELIGIPYTAEQLLSLPSSTAVQVVRDAALLAAERGAHLVGLGAYTSIVTDNAQALGPLPVPVTTGNSFTAAACVEAVERAVTANGSVLPDLTVAVIGAGGSIGRVVATLLGAQARQIILVGRPGGLASPRLAATREAVLAANGGDADRILLSDNVKDVVREAHVVITATSSPDTLVAPEDLRQDALVCDVAEPANVPADLGRLRPDVQHFDGGIVRMPGGRDFGVRHGLPPTVTYACMAETMVLALSENAGAVDPDLFSTGEDLSLEGVRALAELAREHGFTLAPARTWRPSA